MTLYVFDVDGTLTEPTQRMPDELADVFRVWAREKRYFLTSGSTLETMRRQIPPDILSHAEGWFPCMGNEFWEHGKQVYGREVSWPGGLGTLIGQLIGRSQYRRTAKYEDLAGKLLEGRPGMLCFSVVGRGANAEQRAKYAAWDAVHGEREKIAAAIREAYPGLSVTIGGQTSIDVAPKGGDKAQILKALRWGSSLPVVFYGDRTEPGGNDFPLAEALRAEGGNTVVSVSDWRGTMEHLKNDSGR